MGQELLQHPEGQRRDDDRQEHQKRADCDLQNHVVPDPNPAPEA